MLKFSELRGRDSTYNYEISKGLDGKACRLGKEIKEIRASILNLNGRCEYCNKPVKKSSKGDHFYNLTRNGMPTEYCNDLLNRIPACSDCNSSKGGMHWRVWLTSDVSGNPASRMTEVERNALLDKLTRYDEFMQLHCKRKRYNVDCINRNRIKYKQCIDEIILDMQQNAAVEYYTLNDGNVDEITDQLANVSL